MTSMKQKSFVRMAVPYSVRSLPTSFELLLYFLLKNILFERRPLFPFTNITSVCRRTRAHTTKPDMILFRLANNITTNRQSCKRLITLLKRKMYMAKFNRMSTQKPNTRRQRYLTPINQYITKATPENGFIVALCLII